jgi:hypothetical protein
MVRSDIEGTVGAQPTGMFLAGPINGQTAVVSTDVFLGPNGQSCKHTRGAYTDNNIGYMDSGGVTAGSTYVFSAYVYIPSSQAKNFEGKLLRFSMESPNSSNTFASADVTIVDRWQRVWGTCVPTGVNAVWVLRTTANAGSFFYTDCWQLELGSFPTSYMPASGGSQFTRTADLASMTGTNFSSWYNQTEGTFYISTYKQTSPFAAGRRVMEISDGTNNNRTEMGYHTNGPYIFSTYSGITQYQTYPITTFPTTTRQAFSYSQLVNNLTYITSLSSSVSLYNKFLKPSYSILGIGRATAAGTNQFGGTISRLTYYPIQLTNQQLINLTL